MNKLISRKDACARLGGISLTFLHKLINDKKLTSVKLGSMTFIETCAIDELISKNAKG